MSAARDRKVKRMLARMDRGQDVPFEEVFAACPYRTLLGASGTLHPDARPSATVAVLGFVPDDFCDQLRADILNDLRAGRVVALISNSSDLRDYAKREIVLAMSEPTGSA